LGKLVKQSEKFNVIYLDPPYDLHIESIFELVSQVLEKDGVLFLEERYDPKQPNKAHQIPNLVLKNTRRFGIALLSTFIKSSM